MSIISWTSPRPSDSGFAGFQGYQAAKRFLMRTQGLAETAHELSAHRRGNIAPCRKCPHGPTDRRVQFRRTERRQTRHGRAINRRSNSLLLGRPDIPGRQEGARLRHLPASCRRHLEIRSVHIRYSCLQSPRTLQIDSGQSHAAATDIRLPFWPTPSYARQKRGQSDLTGTPKAKLLPDAQIPAAAGRRWRACRASCKCPTPS